LPLSINFWFCLTQLQFLFRCTTGLIDKNANGCIMADEMGLGKTVWHTPYYCQQFYC
jgi:hypothetical protein